MTTSQTLQFLDISSHQHGLNLSSVPHDAVMVKLTQGDYYLNPDADGWLHHEKGRLRGIYHFMATNISVAAQVDYFLKYGSKYLDGKTVICLDYEPETIGLNDDLAGATQWMQEIYARTGIRPWLYQNRYSSAKAWPVEAKQFLLYLAYYGKLPSPVPSINGCNVIAQQYTSTGKFPGWPGALDLDVFFGSNSDWVKQAAPANSKDVLMALSDTDIHNVAVAVVDELLSRTIIDFQGDHKPYAVGSYIAGTSGRVVQILNKLNAGPNVPAPKAL